MAINRPRFVGPYGTEDGEHDALYYQREVKDYVNKVFSGSEVDDSKAQVSSLSCLLTCLADETKRLHGLFNSSEGWYREMATKICQVLRIPLEISTGSDIIDNLRATLAAHVLPCSVSPSEPAYRQAHFYRTVASKLRSLMVEAGKITNIDESKEQFMSQALFVFRGEQ